MDKAVRTQILDLARWAPNIDNAQPFYFRWSEDCLWVLRDEGRDRKRGNAGHIASYVGLGCLLEYVRIAASGSDLRGEFELPGEPSGEEGRWAEVRFTPGAPADPLLPGLRLRASDRRLYQGGRLDAPVFSEIREDLGRIPEVRLSFVEEPGPRLMNYLMAAEAHLWLDKHMLPEMLSWVRWTRAEAERTRDGMPWRSLAVSYPVSRLMYLVSKSSLVRRIVRWSGGPLRAQQENLKAQVASSAALGGLTVREPRPDNFVEAGRAFVRAWLRLNLAGYGVQVMASPALHALQSDLGILPHDVPESSRRVFSRGREILLRSFQAQQDDFPVWMFRTGRSPALPENMRTRRRSLGSWVQS